MAWRRTDPLQRHCIEVSEMIQNLQKQHGFQYTAKMTTNGYLLDEKLFRQFCQAGITSYQIDVYKRQAEDRLCIERKNKQAVQGLLYVRFICFGNGNLVAAHDLSLIHI